ncbi:MAG: neutral/alkaline non-lysosomal ceramidase N-terminal domain-containing protein [Planctomycetota bacterium]|nr:neutral/alkaline non-lysosomal ceramidase N-terminal domain-containing protein [Planctomycetota bacterium]MDA1248283.1 neutral/alkaline non-lysosomal ceramidase N-terminal domain-containing protein [Planctomycetota bacterium]
MPLRFSTVVAATCLVAVCIFRTAAADQDAKSWQAGAAAVKITPDGPAWMAGYASRTEPSIGVELDLFAKTLVVRDSMGETVVLVTLDLISVPGPLRQHVEKSLAESRKLKPENLVMNCSHTHCGPEIRTTGTALDGLDPDRRAMAIAYVETLQQRILSCIDQAFAKLAPAKLSFQKARAAFAMNRRLPSPTGYQNSPNPDGRVDHDVPVLRVEDAEGTITAVVFGYACHNTTLGFQKLCGDYAGFAQQAVEEAHPGTVALFMMGCGGDQNPYPRRTLDLAKQHGRTLATAVEAALSTPKREIAGRLSVAFGTAKLDYAEAQSKEQLQEQQKSTNKYDARYAERLLKELEAGTLLTSYPAPVSVVRFGDAVLFVALPGETVVDYSLRIKRENRKADGPEVWVAGYSNDVFAYIPSLRVLLEGGYEAGGAMRYMTTVVQPGPFAPNVEDRLLERVEQLIQDSQPVK